MAEFGSRWSRATIEASKESNRALSEVKQTIGSWQCQHCHLTAMTTWRGQPNPDDAPACCGGELMLPYRIPSQEALDTKVVSNWIDDIEREERETLIAEGNDPEFMWPI